MFFEGSRTWPLILILIFIKAKNYSISERPLLRNSRFLCFSLFFGCDLATRQICDHYLISVYYVRLRLMMMHMAMNQFQAINFSAIKQFSNNIFFYRYTIDKSLRSLSPSLRCFWMENYTYNNNGPIQSDKNNWRVVKKRTKVAAIRLHI